MANILVVGCGDIGYPVALVLHEKGHHVTAVKRRALSQPAPFPIICADIRRAEACLELPVDIDSVLFIVSPGSRQAEDYRLLYQVGLDNLLSHFDQANRAPRWFMVSSTSVYGQQHGEWVDEQSPTEPISETARWLVAAEQRLWQADALHCVVRFSGIYGPGRDWLIRRVAAGEPIQQQPPSYTNRIHQDDCVAVLVFLLEQYLAGVTLQACYLASDDDPAPLWEVMNWIAEQYAYPAPPALSLPSESEQNKRCRNARLCALGYRLLFSSYRDGYLNPGKLEIG